MRPLVEPLAALQNRRTKGLWNSRTVVFDKYSTIRERPDADACLGMPSGVLDEVAQNLGQVGLVHGDARLAVKDSFECKFSTLDGALLHGDQRLDERRLQDRLH